MNYDPSDFIDSHFCGPHHNQVCIQGSDVVIILPETDEKIRLSQIHLRQLANCRRASVPGLTYFDHCGLHFGTYAEFLIYFHDRLDWPTSNALRFRVGDVLVSAGLCSHLIPPLFEPYYSDDRFNQFEFEGYSSIRLMGVTIESAKRVINEAIYYLNAYYLAPLRSGVQVLNLLTQDDLKYLKLHERRDVVSRKRIRMMSRR